jgi:hypothetical protein
MKCPDNCDCFHDQLWSANVVQCSRKNLTNVPSLVPMDVTALHLDGNNLTKLGQTMFLGRSRLKKILARQSNIHEIDNGTFTGLDHLEVIHLGRNQLKQLLGHEFAGAVSLRELHLEHNQLVTISADTFKHLAELTVLRLDGNLLIEFPIWELSVNRHISDLRLSSNWWNCECTFVRKFRMFIDTLGTSVVKDANRIACNSDHDLRNYNRRQQSCHSVLPNSHIYITDTSGAQDQLVPVIVGVVGLCLALFVMVCVLMCLKDKCRIWLYGRYGIRIEVGRRFKKKTVSIIDGELPVILFDGLVLYSNKDNEPIVSEICQQLEPAYRLCLLHRDLAGIYTSEAFKSALAASSTHIVVLSRAFLATEWQHVQDLVMNYKQLIIINVDMEKLEDKPEDVRNFTRASSRVLPWSDEPGFWNGLKYYLPDPPRLPTKEGGAELDVSGVWTFNDAVGNNVSTSQHMVKRKQQCSVHSSMLTMTMNDSGVYDSLSMANGGTRSCGTNAVQNHQRSSSALVETINGRRPSELYHQRSKSYLVPQHVLSEQQQERPPPPPPKVGKMKRPSGENIYASPPTMLMQLASFSPDLLKSLNATMTTPLSSTSPPSSSNNVRIMSPVTRARERVSQHSKSKSLLVDYTPSVMMTPKSSRLAPHKKQPSPHQRSASMLDPGSILNNQIYPPSSSLVLSNPDLRQKNPIYSSQKPFSTPQQLVQPPLTRRTIMNNHTRSVSMLEEQQRKPSALKLEDLPSRKLLHMSTSQLQHLVRSGPDGAATAYPLHKRSSSTPYEGFIL